MTPRIHSHSLTYQRIIVNCSCCTSHILAQMHWDSISSQGLQSAWAWPDSELQLFCQAGLKCRPTTKRTLLGMFINGMPGRKIPRPRCKYSFVVQRQRDPRRSWVTLSVLPIIESCIPLCSLWTYMHYLCRLWWIKLYEEEGGITNDYSRRAFFDGLRETRRGEPLVQRQLDIAPQCNVLLRIDSIVRTKRTCICLRWHFCSFMYWQHYSHYICLLWHQCALYLSVSTSQSALYLSVLTSAYWQQFRRQHISHQTIHPDILRHNLTRIQLHLKSQKM